MSASSLHAFEAVARLFLTLAKEERGEAIGGKSQARRDEDLHQDSEGNQLRDRCQARGHGKRSLLLLLLLYLSSAAGLVTLVGESMDFSLFCVVFPLSPNYLVPPSSGSSQILAILGSSDW